MDLSEEGGVKKNFSFGGAGGVEKRSCYKSTWYLCLYGIPGWWRNDPLILLLGCFVGFLHFIHGVVCFQWKFDGSTPPSVLWLKFEGENQLDGTCILLLMFSSCFWGGGGVNPIVLFCVLRTVSVLL